MVDGNVLVVRTLLFLDQIVKINLAVFWNRKWERGICDKMIQYQMEDLT